MSVRAGDLIGQVLRDRCVDDQLPDPAGLRELRSWIPGRETIEAVGRELYIAYPDGIGASKLTGAVIERRLKTRGTARNWNTVTKLAALLAD